MSEPFSQVQAIGEPAPRTWDDYERGCLLTFGGGYQDNHLASAFRHGMNTVFNLLRREFPPAEQCRANAKLLSAAESALRWLETLDAPERVRVELRAAIDAVNPD